MTFCTFISDTGIPGTGSPTVMCGLPGEVKNNQAFCPTHRNIVINDGLRKAKRTVVQALDCDLTESVYIIRVPSGNIKIGKAKDVYDRLRTLSCKFGGKVELLACTSGGYQTEARLHVQFDHLRIPDLLGEQFQPDEQLLIYAQSLGIDDAGQWAAKRLEKYIFTGTAKIEPSYLGLAA